MPPTVGLGHRKISESSIKARYTATSALASDDLILRLPPLALVIVFTTAMYTIPFPSQQLRLTSESRSQPNKQEHRACERV